MQNTLVRYHASKPVPGPLPESPTSSWFMSAPLCLPTQLLRYLPNLLPMFMSSLGKCYIPRYLREQPSYWAHWLFPRLSKFIYLKHAKFPFPLPKTKCAACTRVFVSLIKLHMMHPPISDGAQAMWANFGQRHLQHNASICIWLY